MKTQTADLATLRQVIDDTFTALGVTDNEAALVEIERLQAAATPPGRDPATIEAEARFLLSRLKDLDDADDPEYVRQFEGHVRPSMERLACILDPKRS